jgi:hypothetical protein
VRVRGACVLGVLVCVCACVHVRVRVCMCVCACARARGYKPGKIPLTQSLAHEYEQKREVNNPQIETLELVLL